MKVCLVTERENEFNIISDGQCDTNDVNIAAILGANKHLFSGEKDLNKFDGYDLYIVKMSKIREKYETEWMQIVHILKNRYPNSLVAIYQEAEVDWLMFRSWQEQVELIKAVKKCDIFLTHNSIDEGFFSKLTWHDRVFHVRTPLPIEKLDQYIKTLEYKIQKNKILFGSTLDDRSYGLFGYVVASRFKKIYNEVNLIQYHRTTYADSKERNESFMREVGENFEALGYAPWFDFAERMSEMRISMNLMLAAAAGRDAIMFAALGIPHIGNYRLEVMKNCFPGLAIDPLDCNKAYELLEKLYKDKDFYIIVQETAKLKVKEYHSMNGVRSYLREQFKNRLGIEI